MNWSATVAVHHDEGVLQSTLLHSPALQAPGRLKIQRGFRSVAASYVDALQKCRHSVMVFLHPDVYLPDTWESAFQESLEKLACTDPNWGVLGLYGIDRDGKKGGFLYSTGLGGFIGAPFAAPREVRTVDEYVFAIRLDSGLMCDENLPSTQFQLGATDLCLQAERRHMKNYVVPCFSLHNSNRWTHLPLAFRRPYFYVRSKWKKALPIVVPYTMITRSSLPIIKTSLRYIFRQRRHGHRIETRVEDPVSLYQDLREGILSAFR